MNYKTYFKTFRKCDLLNCNKQSSMWTVFHGCGHSFHIACILPNIGDCPICKTALLSKVKELHQTANKSVSNVSVPSAAEESDENEELISDDDDDEYDQLVDDQSKALTLCYQEFAIGARWSRAVMTVMASHNLQNLVTYFRHKVCIKEVRQHRATSTYTIVELIGIFLARIKTRLLKH